MPKTLLPKTNARSRAAIEWRKCLVMGEARGECVNLAYSTSFQQYRSKLQISRNALHSLYTKFSLPRLYS